MADAPRPEGHVTGTGTVFLMKDTGQEALLGARYALAGFDVDIAEHAFRSGGTDYPAGSWVLTAQDGAEFNWLPGLPPAAAPGDLNSADEAAVQATETATAESKTVEQSEFFVQADYDKQLAQRSMTPEGDPATPWTQM